MATQDMETGNTEEALSSLAAATAVDLPPEPELKGPLKPVQETTPKERVAGGIAGAALITAVAAIIVEHSAIVILAGVSAIVLAPYAYYQQTRLTDIATLTETTAGVQQQVERLKSENEQLGNNINELGETIDNLQDVEESLAYITKGQTQSVAALEKQVEQDKKILSKMHRSTKGAVLQNLISVIQRADVDGDMMIGEEEVDHVIKGLDSNIVVSRVHEDRLREKITVKSTEAVIAVVKNLMSDHVPPEERIFEIEETP
jgi:cell division protein FtsB